MPGQSKALSGYIKTSNMYLAVLVALAVGFLGGVVFSSYRSSGMLPTAADTGTAGPVPISQEQRETLAALIKATQTTPDNVNAWTQLGHFYFDSGEYEKAIQAYEKSLQLDGSRPDVWTDLGVMYRRTGNPDKALECFDRALKLDSRHEVALFNKGVVLMHDLKKPKAALEAWQKLIEINPNAKTPDGQSVKAMIDQIKKEDQS